MNWPAFVKRLLLADGRISDTETAMIRRAVASGGIDREELLFLIQLKREAVSVHPDFDELLYQVVKAVVLADGKISEAETDWMRSVIFADGHASDLERAFITRLRNDAERVDPAFEQLYTDVMKLDRQDIWR